MADKTIPIAYVTKWATTRGIVVYRGRSVSERGYLWTGWQSIPALEWTKDRATAELRWRSAILKAANLAEKRAGKLRAQATLAPKYVDREKEEG